MQFHCNEAYHHQTTLNYFVYIVVTGLCRNVGHLVEFSIYVIYIFVALMCFLYILSHITVAKCSMEFCLLLAALV